jgi:hypothetical protein
MPNIWKYAGFAADGTVTETTMPAGYSGAPLAQKLGLKAPMTLVTHDAPDGYRDWLEGLPAGVEITSEILLPIQAAHLFVTQRSIMEERLTEWRHQLEQTGFVWVSWPKKASKVETDITEDTIREVALPMGYVDIKVCAVSEVWSGLKLVIRKTERTS